MIAGRTSSGSANPFRGDKFAEGWLPGRRGGARLRRHRVGVLPRHRRAARLHPGARSSPRRRTWSGTGTRSGSRRRAIELGRLLPGAAAARRFWDGRRRRAETRRAQPCSSGAIVSPASLQLLPVVLGRLARAGPDDRPAAVVDRVGHRHAVVVADARAASRTSARPRPRRCCGRRSGRSRASCRPARCPGRRRAAARSCRRSSARLRLLAPVALEALVELVGRGGLLEASTVAGSVCSDELRPRSARDEALLVLHPRAARAGVDQRSAHPVQVLGHVA